jgi:hypothetical protein
MHETVFFELDFLFLIATSILIPTGIFAYLLKTTRIAHPTVLIFASILISLSAADVFLLQSLAQLVKSTPSLLDDKLFASEISTALYVLPAAFAGIGINLLSHTIIEHLVKAERKFDHEH